MNSIASFDMPLKAIARTTWQRAQPHESVASGEDLRRRAVGGASGGEAGAARHRCTRSLAEFFGRCDTGLAGKWGSSALCGLQCANPQTERNVEVDCGSKAVGASGS